jgi:hypothetical protein
LALGSIRLLVLSVLGGFGLFGLLRPEQQLIFGQALGTCLLGQEHGFQQVRIVGESLHCAGRKMK